MSVQGAEAGGHRGTFLHQADDAMIGLFALLPMVVRAIKIPVIAAGGIMDGRGLLVAEVLGASASQLGTVFFGAARRVPPPHGNRICRRQKRIASPRSVVSPAGRRVVCATVTSR